MEAEEDEDEVAIVWASEKWLLQVRQAGLHLETACISPLRSAPGHRIAPKFDLLQGMRREVGLGCCI